MITGMRSRNGWGQCVYCGMKVRTHVHGWPMCRPCYNIEQEDFLHRDMISPEETL